MNVVPLPVSSRWVDDARGEHRALRVTSHPESGLVTVSLWRDELCVGSVRLTPAEAADLMGAVGDAVAACTLVADEAV